MAELIEMLMFTVVAFSIAMFATVVLFIQYTIRHGQEVHELLVEKEREKRQYEEAVKMWKGNYEAEKKKHTMLYIPKTVAIAYCPNCGMEFYSDRIQSCPRCFIPVKKIKDE